MSEHHWTADGATIVYDPTPGGRKNEDGTTSYSLSFPALTVSEYVTGPEQAAADVARELNVFPELLKALKELLALTEDPDSDADPEESAFAFARSVIAKAEGRQP